MDTVQFRSANKDDSRSIAELYLVASDGVSAYIWQQLAGAGEQLIDVGQRRYEREDTDISYQNATVVEKDGRVIGMLVAYPMVVDAQYVETDPVLKPYSVLEEPDSYYVAAMAVTEVARGQGLGSKLLLHAESAARESGLKKLSLIVFDQNAGAKRLYERNGYAETAREAVVPHPMIHMGGDALLMVRHLQVTISQGK